MKLLGLIGGVSPESTELYYRLLNDAARHKLGGDHSARLIISSFDFHDVVAPYHTQDWERFIQIVVEAAERLKAAGAEALMICSNTTHIAADAVRAATKLPLIHLLDVLAEAIHEEVVTKPLLLGTPAVMAGDYYRPFLKNHHGIECLVPNVQDQDEVNRVIFEELCHGMVLDSARERYLSIIDHARAKGADGVILGCTEIGLLLSQDHTPLKVFDTTRLHADAASRFAFGEDF